MKILLTADPELPVPPGLYGGIERIVEALIDEYIKAGHEVVLCAHPLSNVPCKLVPWRGMHSQRVPDTLKNTVTLTRLVWKESFDVIHSFSRLAYMGFLFPMAIPKLMSYKREPSPGSKWQKQTGWRKKIVLFLPAVVIISAAR